MNRDLICICGPRSKHALTGVALAFDLLVEGLENYSIPHRVVNATRGVVTHKSGAFTIRRAFDSLMVIFHVWVTLLSCKTFYATMSTSIFGFIRDYFCIYFAHLLRRRCILHLHGGGFEDFYLSSPPVFQKLIRSNLSRTDTIIVLGNLLKEQFYCAGDNIKNKIVVVPNGLTLGVKEPESKIKNIQDHTHIELLYLSSLMPSKGFLDVIDTMKIIESEYPNRFHLNLCGSFVKAKTESFTEVYNEESLNKYIKKHELKKCITYHKQVNGEEKHQQFQSAHIFILPTNYKWEGQPLSIIEAMAYSIPVITCRHKGIPELVEENITGIFVEPSSPPSIAAKVLEIATNKKMYQSMSEKSRKKYESGFTARCHLKKLFKTILN
tara:strand:- start:3223 stop:4365 length:1143 start_codon:yes stop_codon:yes gene_type:complete